MAGQRRRSIFPILPFLLLAVALLLVGSCARTPIIDYYQLVFQKGSNQHSLTGVDAVLGLGPVHLPEYLDQPKIVSRLSPNRLFLADSHRWVEPLADNFTRVLQQELDSLLHPRQILTFPWPLSQKVDCQLVVDVLRFETANDGKAQLLVTWMVRDRQGKLIQAEKQASYQKQAAGADYSDRVHALNEVLNQFGQDMAKALRPLLREAASD